MGQTNIQIRQIIFYVEFLNSDLKDIGTDVIWFDWDGKSPVMDSAFPALKKYMNEKYPDKEYGVKDWEWADRRI